jgi:hypothetical protein
MAKQNKADIDAIKERANAPWIEKDY